MKLECFYYPFKGLSVIAFLICTVPNLSSADSSSISCILNGTLLDWVPFLTGALQDHSTRRRPKYHIHRLWRKIVSFRTLAFQPCRQGEMDFCQIGLDTSNYLSTLPNLSQHPNPAEIYQEGYLLFQYVYNGIFHMSRLLNQSEHEQRHQRHAHMGTQLHLRRKLCKFNNAAVLILKDLLSGIKDCIVCQFENTLHKDRQFAPLAVLDNSMDRSYLTVFFDAFIHWAQESASTYSIKLMEFIVTGAT